MRLKLRCSLGLHASMAAGSGGGPVVVQDIQVRLDLMALQVHVLCCVCPFARFEHSLLDAVAATVAHYSSCS